MGRSFSRDPIVGHAKREVVTVSEPSALAATRTVGIRDIPLVLVSPRRVFARVEDVAIWGWPLLILLTFVTLIGYATVQTELIDREVDRRVQQRIEVIDRTQRDVVERSALSELYAQQVKQGEFEKLLTRIQVVIAAPAQALAIALLVAALLFGVVALTGRKPEWHTLLTICVFAGFIDALRMLMTLGLMLQHRTLNVYTSLAPLARFLVEPESKDPTRLAAARGLLSAADPFFVWYWVVVIIGLSATGQLRGWRAWSVCCLCWLVAAGARCGVEVARLNA